MTYRYTNNAAFQKPQPLKPGLSAIGVTLVYVGFKNATIVSNANVTLAAVTKVCTITSSHTPP